MTGPGSTINFVRFNQDVTSLALGSSSGYKLFSLTSVDKLEPIYSWSNQGSPEGKEGAASSSSVIIVERLFSSSLLGLVNQAEPRKLRVCHFKKGTEICNYSYSNTILAVKMNRARLVVCLEDSLFIHNIRDMKILHTIRETPPNPRGLCALSINSDNCFLAYPGSNITGEVQLFDAFNLQAKIMIPAHESPLAALTFNPSGTRLATASEKGTVIRVFSVEDGSRLVEFRRGVKRCATVYCLSFSQDSHFLVLSSNTETIHVFRFDEEQQGQQQHQQELQRQAQAANAGGQEDNSWMGYLSKAVSTTASYLPAQVTDTLNQTRAVATLTVPNSPVIAPNTVAIANISRQTRLLLASSDGYLYIYNLPGGDGGECILVKQHRIDPDCTSDSASAADNLAHPDNIGTSDPTPAPRRPSAAAEEDLLAHSPDTGPAVLKVTSGEQLDFPETEAPPSPQPQPSQAKLDL